MKAGKKQEGISGAPRFRTKEDLGGKIPQWLPV
jgi:hypothetical protein